LLFDIFAIFFFIKLVLAALKNHHHLKNKAINQFVNFFWTILCFIPVLTYWFGNHTYWLYIFILVSLIFVLLPASIFRYFQLSSNRKYYEQLGVKLIQQFVQNGTFVNRAIRKNNPEYKLIKDRTQALQYLNTINMYERYHFLCFIFFALTFIHALISQRYVAAVLILVVNVIYNVCPLLIQQYNKLRVMRI
jgi:glycosyl-4,4'-diaponeurosporenoate acyltransferase